MSPLYQLTEGQQLIPSLGTFPLTLCTTPERFDKIVEALHYFYHVNADDEYIIDFLEALHWINDNNAPCVVNQLPDGSCCFSYAPNSAFIGYAPNDPFQTPELTPSGYNAPPWRQYDENLLTQLGGLMPSDAIVSLWAFAPSEWWQFIIPFATFVSTIANLPNLISSGLPRFKVNVRGSGTVELHLLAIPLGGDAFITVDGNVNSNTVQVNLASYTIGSIADVNDFVSGVMGFVVTANDPVQVVIVEVELEGEGDHYIDVTFIPHIDLTGDLGFGGGVRKVVLCGQDLTMGDAYMPEFRMQGCIIQWRPNTGASWADIGNPLSGLEVSATTLEAGESATAEITDCALVLGIPRGSQGIQGIQGEATNGIDGVNGIDGKDAVIRVSEGQLQFQNEGEASWANLISIDEIANATECGCSPVPLPSGDTSDDYRCGMAIGLQGYVWQMYTEMQDQIALAGTVADAVINFIGAIPVLGWEVSSIWDVIGSINDIGQASLDVLDTLENREALQQAWYCLLNDNDVLEDTELTAMRTAIDTILPTALATVIGQIFDAIPESELKRRAWLYAQSGNADNCVAFDCGGDDFCHLFDLTTMATLDPQLNPPEAVYPAFSDFVPYEGMRSGIYFDGYADLRRSGVIITVPAGVTVTSIRVKYAGHIGVSSFEIFEGSSYTRIHFVDYNTNNFSEYTANLNVIGAGQPLEIVKTTEYTPRPNDGLQYTHHVLREIEVCGIGDDPWT